MSVEKTSEPGGVSLAAKPWDENHTHVPKSTGSLFSPIFDFLFVGGGSIILLGVFYAFVPVNQAATAVAISLIVAHFINSPHFAHSYQIIYKDFVSKAFLSYYDPMMKARYIWAAVVAPIIIILYFAVGAMTENGRLLGYGANVMFLLVGWHYAKQGYGVLIVMSVAKKAFFNSLEKRIFLINAYAVWAAAWMHANRAVAEHEFRNLAYYTFDVPDVIYDLSIKVFLITSLAVAFILIKIVFEGRKLPANGVVGYLITLYLWTLFIGINPIFAAFIPAFHSLQYLLIVWRYEINEAAVLAQDRKDSQNNSTSRRFVILRVGYFIGIGIVMGYAGFWLIPEFLDGTVHYSSEIFGATMFVAMFSLFINIHHYLIDNVIWRRQNPDARKYLFATNSS